jgi:hypothetical protein
MATGISGEPHSPTLRLFPNPVSDKLLWETSDKVVRIEIYGSDGRLMLSENNPTNPVTVSGLHTGVYTVKFMSKNVDIQQFVKQ